MEKKHIEGLEEIQKEYSMGTDKILRGWREDAQQLTFVVTQECNLRCKYCYMVGKNDENRMSLEVAKRAIDYFIDNKNDFFQSDYLVLDFIGGEPLLEIDLITQITDYFKLSTYKKKSPWFGRYRISIGSNGILYNSKKVQQFIAKNKNMVSIGITLDGTKDKHDMQRVYPDGSGSYDDVVKNILMSLSQGIGSGTKVTIGHDDLPLLKESIIHLWSLGIKDIPANIVFEDVWEKNDPKIYEDQLTELADHIIQNHLWNKYNVTLFSENLGFKRKEKDMMHGVCGTGRMYCIDANGDIYSCVRFMEYSLHEKESKKYGNVYDGIDKDKMRSFKVLYEKYIIDDECLNCQISSDCMYCAGYNYDETTKNTLFDRSKAICDMHKARVRANNYFWARLYNEHNITRKSLHKQERFIYFLLSTDSVNYCNYTNSDEIVENITPEKLIEGLKYAFDNFYQPVFIHSSKSQNWLAEVVKDTRYGELLKKEMARHIILEIAPFNLKKTNKDVMYVFDENSVDKLNYKLERPCILVIDSDHISDLSERTIKLLQFASRVNINIRHSNNLFDLAEYKQQLERISNYLEEHLRNGYRKEVGQLTDRIFLQSMNSCYAGEKNLTYAPDGEFYLCPAFYYDNRFNNTNIDIVKEQTYLNRSPVCNNCDAYQCNRCIYMSKKRTGEFNIPSKIQCEIAHIEREVSRKLLNKLKDIEKFSSYDIPNITYSDPLEYLEIKDNRI